MTMTAIDWHRPVSSRSFAVFRMFFGALLTIFCARYVYYGWVETQLTSPSYHFTYLYFDWIKPLSQTGMYAVFAGLFCASLGIAFGGLYRLSCVCFLVGFTYIELIDKTYYLNHYYLISVILLMMVFIPMNQQLALDAVWRRRQNKPTPSHVPQWMIWVVRFQVGLVYFYAGIAKLNADWLIHAQPLRTWLPARSYMPLIGKWLVHPEVAYLASWGGCLFDLSIVFFLLHKKTRRYAYIVLICFHIMTWLAFPIGVFPWVMIACVTVFFEPHLFDKKTTPNTIQTPRNKSLVVGLLFCAIQALIPLRSHLYPGDVLWHEQGFRFSWRVMLVEKSGLLEYEVEQGGRRWAVYPSDHLNETQRRMMSTQPDMILQYAHYLAQKYEKPNQPVRVYAHVWVAAQGRASARLIDSTVNLAAEPRGFAPKRWIIKQ